MKEKKFPLYMPLAMIVMVVLLCRNDLQSKDTEIAAYIEKNLETLTSMASTALDKGSETIQLIDGINSINCWNGSESYVDFKYYSIGLGSAVGTHYGFYYSPDDTPSAYEAQDINLISGENGWSWTSDGNNSGFTKKLMDNWYYYEVTF